MLSLSQIQSIKSDMATLVDAMQTRLDRLFNQISDAKSSTSHSAQYIRETVEKLQHDALPYFGESLKTLNEQAKIIKAQKVAWNSKPLLLSMQNFSDNEQADSTIRLRYSTELSKMDAALLKLTADVAKEENNLPLVYQCYLTATSDRAKYNVPNGEAPIYDLTTVEIPDQAEAIEAINVCLTYPARGELIAGQSTTAGLTATRKMDLGRQARV